MNNGPRLSRERRTIEAMLRIHCRGNHGGGMLCEECSDLLTYANTRLDRCPFGEEKPTCTKCRVHCYRGDYRDRVRAVMRYAGPRMILRHPLLAIAHMLDGRKISEIKHVQKDKP